MSTLCELESRLGFIYCAHRPFHPQRFCRVLHQEWTGVSRIKGFFWVASCIDRVGLWTFADGTTQVSCAGRWWAAKPEREWPASAAARAEIRRCWQGSYGDRRQEISFIGAEMNRAEVFALLDAILLTDEEMAQGEATDWQCYADDSALPKVRTSHL